MTKLGTSLLHSLTEARAIARGEAEPARVIGGDALAIATIRKRLGLSQDKFARRFNLPPASVRDWEQGRRAPDAAARNFLRVIDYAPETDARALAAGGGVDAQG